MEYTRCNVCDESYYDECDYGHELLPDGVYCDGLIIKYGVPVEEAEKALKMNASWCEHKQCLACVDYDHCDNPLPDTTPCPKRFTYDDLHRLYKEKRME